MLCLSEHHILSSYLGNPKDKSLQNCPLSAYKPYDSCPAAVLALPQKDQDGRTFSKNLFVHLSDQFLLTDLLLCKRRLFPQRTQIKASDRKSHCTSSIHISFRKVTKLRELMKAFQTWRTMEGCRKERTESASQIATAFC